MPAGSTQTRKPAVLDQSEGEALWFNNDLLTFKSTGEQTGGEFLLVEELARGGKVTPLHAHPDEQETFYVLEGEALFHLDGRERAVAAGGFVSVPPGVPHAYLATSEVFRSLILVTPGDGGMEASSARPGNRPASERSRKRGRSTSRRSVVPPSAPERCSCSAPRRSGGYR